MAVGSKWLGRPFRSFSIFGVRPSHQHCNGVLYSLLTGVLGRFSIRNQGRYRGIGTTKRKRAFATERRNPPQSDTKISGLLPAGIIRKVDGWVDFGLIYPRSRAVRAGTIWPRRTRGSTGPCKGQDPGLSWPHAVAILWLPRCHCCWCRQSAARMPHHNQSRLNSLARASACVRLSTPSLL